MNEVIAKLKARKQRADATEQVPVTVKSKKRRLQEDANSSTGSSSTSVASTGAPLMELRHIRAELTRCMRDIKSQEGEFSLPAFDATLKRLVDIVASLSVIDNMSDATGLTTALFAVVEQVGKISDITRRRDRLVCVEGLLKVAIESTDMPLPAQRRTMALEYLQNCQKSIQLISRGVVPSPRTTTASPPKANKRKKKSGHTHFD